MIMGFKRPEVRISSPRPKNPEFSGFFVCFGFVHFTVCRQRKRVYFLALKNRYENHALKLKKKAVPTGSVDKVLEDKRGFGFLPNPLLDGKSMRYVAGNPADCPCASGA